MRIVFTLLAAVILAGTLTGCRAEVEVGDTRAGVEAGR